MLFGLKFTIVLEVLRIVPMYCLHHVGWIRGAFRHSSLPSQFYLVSVRLPLNQHNLFPIPRLGHANCASLVCRSNKPRLSRLLMLLHRQVVNGKQTVWRLVPACVLKGTRRQVGQLRGTSSSGGLCPCGKRQMDWKESPRPGGGWLQLCPPGRLASVSLELMGR